MKGKKKRTGLFFIGQEKRQLSFFVVSVTAASSSAYPDLWHISTLFLL